MAALLFLGLNNNKGQDSENNHDHFIITQSNHPFLVDSI